MDAHKAGLIAARPEVDLVAIGADQGGEELMRLLRPDVLVSDSTNASLAALLREWGGEVRAFQ